MQPPFRDEYLCIESRTENARSCRQDGVPAASAQKRAGAFPRPMISRNSRTVSASRSLRIPTKATESTVTGYSFGPLLVLPLLPRMRLRTVSDHHGRVRAERPHLTL